MSIITTIQNYITEISKNQFLAGMLALYGAGVLTFLLKDIPSKFFKFINKHITTSLTIANFNISYYNLLELLEKENIVNKIRRIRFQNGKWGDGESIKKAVGLGSHCVIFRNRLLFISVVQLESKGYEEKLEITLTKFGRSHKFFENLKKDLSLDNRDVDLTKTYLFNQYSFDLITTCKNRPLSSIFFDGKKELIEKISNFVKNEDWYFKHGIPYQLGILLEGPPGTGKTSLIKALAGYFNYNICILSVSDIHNIRSAIKNLPKKSFLVIEDIDTFSGTHKRKDEALPESDANKFEEFLGYSLSDILNSIDGLLVQSGRILFMTTNHVEKLDEALIRSGRVDLQTHIGYVTYNSFKDFLLSFFPDKEIPTKNIKENVTIAKLQGLIIENKDFDYFIREFLI